jgi:hypothetical protein
LIFTARWRMFTRAHGSLLLPEGSASRGTYFPFGAPESSVGHASVTYLWKSDRMKTTNNLCKS